MGLLMNPIGVALISLHLKVKVGTIIIPEEQAWLFFQQATTLLMKLSSLLKWLLTISINKLILKTQRTILVVKN